MKNKRIFAAFIIFLFFAVENCFCQTNTSPEPYSDDEFPQFMLDLRRFEIITLGSMPFITLNSSIVYNGYKFATGKSDTFNPLATADYSQDEMENIIITSLCISAGIGLTDYIVNLVKRSRINRRLRQQDSNISIEEDPDAVRIPLPSKESSEVIEIESEAE
jgi:hypothetical protein